MIRQSNGKSRRKFERYAKVCGTNLSAERRTALLLHCLGSEGQEVFDHLPDVDDQTLNEYEICILKLDKHYLPKVSTILKHYHFGRRTQYEGESIENCVTALRKLASSCKFGALLEERIRDQFMLGCSVGKVRSDLWQKDEPALEEVISFAKQIEHSLKCVDVITKCENKDNTVLYVKSNSKEKDFKKSTFEKPQGKNVRDVRLKCYRCESENHLANDKKCPGLKSRCSNCKKIGHFTSVCKVKKNKGKVLAIAAVVISDNESECYCGQIVSQASDNRKKGPLDDISVEDKLTSLVWFGSKNHYNI